MADAPLSQERAQAQDDAHPGADQQSHEEQDELVDVAYGRCADALRNVLGLMEGHYISGLGDDAAKPTAEVKLLPGSQEKAEAFWVMREQAEVADAAESVAEAVRGWSDPKARTMKTAHVAAA